MLSLGYLNWCLVSKSEAALACDLCIGQWGFHPPHDYLNPANVTVETGRLCGHIRRAPLAVIKLHRVKEQCAATVPLWCSADQRLPGLACRQT